jgi:hypothetical protein
MRTIQLSPIALPLSWGALPGSFIQVASQHLTGKTDVPARLRNTALAFVATFRGVDNRF